MGSSRNLRRLKRPMCLMGVALGCVMGTYVFVINLTPLDNAELPHIKPPALIISSDADRVCVQPKLQLYPDKKFRQFFWNVPKTKCNMEEDWVYVENGTFRYSARARARHAAINCDYIPLVRNDDFRVTESNDTRIRGIHHGAKITSDFFKVECSAKNNRYYQNYHAGVAPIQEKSPYTRQPTAKSLDLNVLIWGFDSVSRLTWMRKLPKTYDYLVNSLRAVVLEGYNIVGDGTPQALLPILCGKTELELPEARRGHPGATTVDDYPWIWKDFKKAGYVTQWTEDGVWHGTFTYRMLGFRQQPVDHYMRTFYLQAEKTYHKYKPYCLGSQHRHNIMLNWLRDLFHSYPNRRKFSFGFHSECSHGNNNPLSMVDEDVVNFLRFMNDKGFLNDTLLILMSDKGVGSKDLRDTLQGKHEERNPFFSLRLPPWFAEKHPIIAQNLRENAKRLTTPFDIHETLMDIIDFQSTSIGKLTNRGLSLFSKIPKERTCAQAGIEPHWCTCFSGGTIETSDPIVQRAARHFVFHINRLTSQSTQQCHTLKLNEVTNAAILTPNQDLLKFKKSFDSDGRIPDLSDQTKPDIIIYQLNVRTHPGGGHFEVTVQHALLDDTFSVSEHEVSRTNKYGDSSACIAGNFPHLKAYCVCRGPDVMPFR